MKACVIVHVPVCNNSRIISNITKGEIWSRGAKYYCWSTFFREKLMNGEIVEEQKEISFNYEYFFQSDSEIENTETTFWNYWIWNF